MRRTIWKYVLQLFSRPFYDVLKKSWPSWISTHRYFYRTSLKASVVIYFLRNRVDWPVAKNKDTIRRAISPFVIVQNVNIYGTSNTFNSTLEISMFPKRKSVRMTVDSKYWFVFFSVSLHVLCNATSFSAKLKSNGNRMSITCLQLLSIKHK